MVREKMGNFELALQDGDEAVKLDAKWSKGYFRRGKALAGCQRFKEAGEAFKQALELEPSNKALPKEIDAMDAAAAKQATEQTKATAEAAEAAVSKPKKAKAEPQ